MGDKQKALERVNDLIRRSLSTDSTEEARTCAAIAVQLIGKHEMVVQLPNTPPTTGLGQDIDDLYDTMGAWHTRVRPNRPNRASSAAVTMEVGGLLWRIQARGGKGTCDGCLKPYHAREVVAVCASTAISLFLHRGCLNERRRYVEGQHHARGGDYKGRYWASRRAKGVGRCIACKGVILPQEVAMLCPGIESDGIHLPCFRPDPKPAPPPQPTVPFEDL